MSFAMRSLRPTLAVCLGAVLVARSPILADQNPPHDLRTLGEMSLKQAQAVVAKGGPLDLDGLKALSADVAGVLGTHV